MANEARAASAYTQWFGHWVYADMTEQGRPSKNLIPCVLNSLFHASHC